MRQIMIQLLIKFASLYESMVDFVYQGLDEADKEKMRQEYLDFKSKAKIKDDDR